MTPVMDGVDDVDNMDVFVTGSNAKLLSKDIATEFAGRGDEIHMYPLSFAEFMNVYNGDKYMGLSEYMLYGGISLILDFATQELTFVSLSRLILWRM